MADPQQYIKFMSDIIDSGAWAQLSSGAKTLYPVLLKFSDQNFKQVWPSTSTLLKLTGFKTKKSVIDAKKDLIEKGLIQTKSGSGHSNSVYYFTFNYPGSKIIPRWDNFIHPRGADSSTAGGDGSKPQGDETGNPNHINITITNTQIQKEPEKDKKKKLDSSSEFEKLIDDYGEEIYAYAYAIAKSKDLQNNIAYMRGICKKKTEELGKMTNNKQVSANRVSWNSFLEWTDKKLTKASSNLLKELEVEASGSKLLIFGQVSEFLEQVIRRYFVDNSDIPVEIEFENMPKKNRVFS